MSIFELDGKSRFSRHITHWMMRIESYSKTI